MREKRDNFETKAARFHARVVAQALGIKHTFEDAPQPGPRPNPGPAVKPPRVEPPTSK